MSSFVESLELSVRTVRLLKEHQVESHEQFMALDRKTMRSWDGCGIKTINEVSEIQRSLRGSNLPDHLIQFVIDNERLIQAVYEGRASIIVFPHIERNPA